MENSAGSRRGGDSYDCSLAHKCGTIDIRNVLETLTSQALTGYRFTTKVDKIRILKTMFGLFFTRIRNKS